MVIYYAKMFFKYKKTPSGQVLQLTESYRNEHGSPRHRVVVSIGDARIPKEDQFQIAKAVEKELYGIQELFPPKYSVKTMRWIDKLTKRIDREGRWRPIQKYKQSKLESTEDDEIVDGVIIDKIKHTGTTLLGSCLVGLHAWRQLKMDEYLKGLGFNTVQCNTAAVSIINRLVEPMSEYALLEWLSRTSLPDLLKWNSAAKDRYYRVSDKLLENKTAIEKHLRDRQGELFNLDRSILLYDLTNSHFEGVCKKNPKAKRGKNKQKRNDCPQIVVGMVFDREGFELAHKIFEGNKNDSKSLPDMVEELEALLETDLISRTKKPIVILDAGVATRKNLQLLKSKGFSYLVNDSRRKRKVYKEEFLNEEGFIPISGRDGKPEVKVCRITDPHPIENKKSSSKEKKEDSAIEEIVLCKSEKRGEKEKAILSNAETKYQEALKCLVKRVEKGQLKDPKKIHIAVGRLQAKHPRVQRYYEVEVKEINSSPSSIPAVMKEKKKKPEFPPNQVIWRYKEETDKEEELFGCYVLRTDKHTISAEELWKLYITMTRAEDGFKALKSTLGLRPNNHHKEERVDAHVFNTIIAYHLLRSILYRLETLGDTRCWETIKRILQTHCYTTIIVPTNTGKSYRIRKAGEPEEVQKDIYQKLGIDWENLPISKVGVKKNETTL